MDTVTRFRIEIYLEMTSMYMYQPTTLICLHYTLSCPFLSFSQSIIYNMQFVIAGGIVSLPMCTSHTCFFLLMGFKYSVDTAYWNDILNQIYPGTCSTKNYSNSFMSMTQFHTYSDLFLIPTSEDSRNKLANNQQLGH